MDLNPNVREPVNLILGDINNILLIESQQYVLLIYLMTRVHIILIDSGGIQEQEEAPLTWQTSTSNARYNRKAGGGGCRYG